MSICGSRDGLPIGVFKIEGPTRRCRLKIRVQLHSDTICPCGFLRLSRRRVSRLLRDSRSTQTLSQVTRTLPYLTLHMTLHTIHNVRREPRHSARAIYQARTYSWAQGLQLHQQALPLDAALDAQLSQIRIVQPKQEAAVHAELVKVESVMPQPQPVEPRAHLTASPR